MTEDSTSDAPPKRGWLLRPLRWLWVALRSFVQFLLLAWVSLAIYYSNLPVSWLRSVLAVAMLLFGIYALWIARQRKATLVFAGLYLAVIVWWGFIPPSHDRPWRREVASLPRATIDGDVVRISGVRNFDFRTRDDFTERYEEREVRLSKLTSLDFYVSYWQVGPLGHTFVSFNFSDAPPICISIETRPEVGEGFDPIASLFKQFELIYVVGDERDLVRLRTDFRNEETWLYRINATPDQARALFLVYLDRINELADQPEWYHLLKNSCTINIVRYANKIGREPAFDINLLLNGWSDRYLYRTGRIDTSLPFEELRERSRITEKSQQAGDVSDFWRQIRAGLPGMDK